MLGVDREMRVGRGRWRAAVQSVRPLIAPFAPREEAAYHQPLLNEHQASAHLGTQPAAEGALIVGNAPPSQEGAHELAHLGRCRDGVVRVSWPVLFLRVDSSTRTVVELSIRAASRHIRPRDSIAERHVRSARASTRWRRWPMGKRCCPVSERAACHEPKARLRSACTKRRMATSRSRREWAARTT